MKRKNTIPFRWMGRRPKTSFLGLLLCSLGLSQPSFACRQALVLGLDVSASVGEIEYGIQRDGLVAALRDPDVGDAMIGAAGSEVMLLVFEWGSPGYHRDMLGWRKIDSSSALKAAAQTIAGFQRIRFGESTAIGDAMRYGAARLDEQSHCTVHTIDLSGDGKNNVGPRPQDVKPEMTARGINVNGLVIATRDIAELNAYYHANVVVGPQAFVETAGGFEDYAKAIKRKILRELTPSLVHLHNRVGGDRRAALDP